jgi:hypothetical protein
VLVIVAFAFYPQQALVHGEAAVKASVQPALKAGAQQASAGQTASSQGATP